MGKKKKKKKGDSSGEAKPKLFKKKHKRFLRNLVVLLLVGGSGLVLWKPDLVKDEAQRERVEGFRDKISGITTSGQEVAVDKFSGLGKVKGLTDNISGEVSIGDKEVYFEEVVKAVSSELENLPIENYQKFRANFCADLVATVSAEVSE